MLVVDSPDNVIGGRTLSARNVISGNVGAGLLIQGDRTRVAGNLIGLAADGLSGLGNSIQGVRLEAADATIGGTTAGARNVISGNGGTGLLLNVGTTRTLVRDGRGATPPASGGAGGRDPDRATMRGMPTREDILEALKSVIDPELKKDVVELGMVREIWPAMGERISV